MSPDLLTQLAEIRRRQGLEPIPDPRVIQGFGPGSDPPPPFMPSSVTERAQFENPDEEEPEGEPQTFTSPLLEAARPQGAPRMVPRAEEAVRPEPKFELIVCDLAAGYRGHTVELNTAERKAIIGVVLSALHRTLDDLRREVQAAESITAAEKEALQAPLPPPPRKRGRPRKVVI